MPADDSDPTLSRIKGLSPSSLVLHLGSNCFAADDFPVVIASVRGVPALTVDRTMDGGIAVTVDVWDENHKIIARIERNEFTINPNNYFRKFRPDRSTLIVEDQYGVRVLEARYGGKRSLSLNAKLRYPNGVLLDLSGSPSIGNICVAVPHGRKIASFINFG